MNHTAANAGAPADVAMLSLDKSGMICHCNRSAEALFRYCSSELSLSHVSRLLPQLADLDLLENDQASRRLHFLCHIGRQFEAVKQDGEHFASELALNVLDTRGRGILSLIVRPVEAAVDTVACLPSECFFA